MKNLLEKYRELPESTGNIPDLIWDAQRELNDLCRLRSQLSDAELAWQLTTQNILLELRRNWTDSEIRLAGLADT